MESWDQNRRNNVGEKSYREINIVSEEEKMGGNNGYSGGAVLFSFLLGGLVGAGVALLTAPESGENVRKRIRDLTDETWAKTGGYIDKAKERIGSSIEKGKDIYEEKKSAISSAIEAGKEAYEKEKEKHIEDA